MTLLSKWWSLVTSLEHRLKFDHTKFEINFCDNRGPGNIMEHYQVYIRLKAERDSGCTDSATKLLNSVGCKHVRYDVRAM